MSENGGIGLALVVVAEDHHHFTADTLLGGGDSGFTDTE
jgi:hypothetical protein